MNSIAEKTKRGNGKQLMLYMEYQIQQDKIKQVKPTVDQTPPQFHNQMKNSSKISTDFQRKQL